MDLPYPSISPSDSRQGLIWRRADKRKDKTTSSTQSERPYTHVAPTPQWISGETYLDSYEWLVPNKGDQEKLITHGTIGRSPWWLVSHAQGGRVTEEEVDAFARLMGKVLVQAFLAQTRSKVKGGSPFRPAVAPHGDSDYNAWEATTDDIWKLKGRAGIIFPKGSHQGGQYNRVIRNAHETIYGIKHVPNRDKRLASLRRIDFLTPEAVTKHRHLLEAIWILSHCSLINRALEKVRNAGLVYTNYNGDRRLVPDVIAYQASYEQWDLSQSNRSMVEFNLDALKTLREWMATRPGLDGVEPVETKRGGGTTIFPTHPTVVVDVVLDDPQYMIASSIDVLITHPNRKGRKEGEIIHFIAKPNLVRLTDFALPALQAALYVHQDVRHLTRLGRQVDPITQITIVNLLHMTIDSIPLLPKYTLFMLPLGSSDEGGDVGEGAEGGAPEDASPLHLIPRTLAAYSLLDPTLPESVSPQIVMPRLSPSPGPPPGFE